MFFYSIFYIIFQCFSFHSIAKAKKFDIDNNFSMYQLNNDMK